jgi:hypothetical protein
MAHFTNLKIVFHAISILLLITKGNEIRTNPYYKLYRSKAITSLCTCSKSVRKR